MSDIVSLSEMTLILKFICQCDVKFIMTLLTKTIMSVLNVIIYIIICVTARPIRLAVILVIMSVSTFKTDIIQ